MEGHFVLVKYVLHLPTRFHYYFCSSNSLAFRMQHMSEIVWPSDRSGNFRLQLSAE